MYTENFASKNVSFRYIPNMIVFWVPEGVGQGYQRSLHSNGRQEKLVKLSEMIEYIQ